MKKKTKPSRSDALVAAQEKYNDKLKKEKRRRLPGSFIPEKYDSMLRKIQKDNGDCGLATALWICVEHYVTSKGK